MSNPRAPGDYRTLPVLLSLIVGVSFLGYLVGVRPPQRFSQDPAGGPTVRASHSQGVPAMEYGDRPRNSMSPNRDWRTVLESKPRPLISGLPVPTREDKQAELQRRALRRAYDGAPPTIPHEVDAVSTAECLVCHEFGLSLATVSAPAMPHEPYAMCTQCHVRAGGTESVFSTSSFSGRAARDAGSRYGPGSPPTIPHSTWMRENCMSCHGDGSSALRTSHPERRNCRQCHGAAAVEDQLPVGESTLGTPLPVAR